MKKVLLRVVPALVVLGVVGTVALHQASAQVKDKKAKAGAATFQVYADKGGEFRFRLRDGEGKLLAISGKGYEKKAECMAVIDAIRREAAKAKVEEEKEAKDSK